MLRHRRGRGRVLLPVLADRAGGERDLERGGAPVSRRHVEVRQVKALLPEPAVFNI